MIQLVYRMDKKNKPYEVRFKFLSGKTKLLKRFDDKSLALDYALRFNQPIESYTKVITIKL
jgi:hypothetical protein